MEMEYIETLLLDERRDLIGEMKAERDAGHRVVDGDRDGAPDPIELGRVQIDVGTTRGREDSHVVPKQAQLPGEVLYVVGHAAGRSKVIRRDEADFHRAAPSPLGGRVG